MSEHPNQGMPQTSANTSAAITAHPGDRVRAVRFHVSHEGTRDEQGLIRDANGEVLTIDDNITVPPGTEGTVTSLDGIGQIHVNWDNGSRIALLPEYDQFECLS